MRRVEKEVFLDNLHVRKRELAEGLLRETPPVTLQEQGFSASIIVDMAHRIRREIVDMEDFRVSFEVQNYRIVETTNDDHPSQRYANEPLEGGCCEG